MRTDPTRVRQILLNLIGNALKFTREGSIHVRASTLEMRGKPFMRIDVQDTGMGMEPGEAAMLFEPFRQADVSIGRRFGGSGLGLAVSRRLARLLGGDLVLLSTVKNEGSTFRLTLPMMATEDAPTIPLEHPTTAPPVVASAKRAPICLGAQTRVLLAEDCEDIQRLIAGILRRAGADVAVAATGFAAVEIALLAEKTARPFRVILMDMQMPVLDGYEAAKRLRKEGFRRPIIALTACAMTGDRERCLGIGCDDYLSKPIDRILLLETVLKHIS